MEDGSNIERNMLLKYKLDSTERQARSCVMMRKYYSRILAKEALRTKPRINNVCVFDKKEVFKHYIVVINIILLTK